MDQAILTPAEDSSSSTARSCKLLSLPVEILYDIIDVVDDIDVISSGNGRRRALGQLALTCSTLRRLAQAALFAMITFRRPSQLRGLIHSARKGGPHVRYIRHAVFQYINFDPLNPNPARPLSYSDVRRFLSFATNLTEAVVYLRRRWWYNLQEHMELGTGLWKALAQLPRLFRLTCMGVFWVELGRGLAELRHHGCLSHVLVQGLRRDASRERLVIDGDLPAVVTLSLLENLPPPPSFEKWFPSLRFLECSSAISDVDLEVNPDLALSYDTLYPAFQHIEGLHLQTRSHLVPPMPALRCLSLHYRALNSIIDGAAPRMFPNLEVVSVFWDRDHQLRSPSEAPFEEDESLRQQIRRFEACTRLRQIILCDHNAKVNTEALSTFFALPPNVAIRAFAGGRPDMRCLVDEDKLVPRPDRFPI